MRRFFLTVTLAAAAIIILASEYRKGMVAPSTDKVATAPDTTTAAPANAEPQVAHPPVPAKAEPKAAHNAAPAQVQQQVAAAPSAAPAAQTPPQADVVSYGASHTTSSASVKATEEEFAKLSLVDQKAAVQRELARLGCYGAKVDGLWGRKSMAAVKAFNTHSGANLQAWPSAKLAKVLRAAPDGACTIASLKGKGTGAPKGADGSHMPVWVREARLASADPKGVASGAAVSTTEAPRKAAKSRERSKIAKANSRKRVAYRPSKDWAPKDWPASAR
jgi:hypothetical protein